MKKKTKIIIISVLILFIPLIVFCGYIHLKQINTVPKLPEPKTTAEQEKTTLSTAVQDERFDKSMQSYTDSTKNQSEPIAVRYDAIPVNSNSKQVIIDKKLIVLPQSQQIIQKTRVFKLHRIDFSGVYYFEDCTNLKYILIDGVPTEKFSFTGNGNIDVWESKLNSVVEAVTYIE